MLDRMTKPMGRRLPVTVAEGNLMPHDPVQAAKFASEAGVIVRGQVPILTHWKNTSNIQNILMASWKSYL